MPGGGGESVLNGSARSLKCTNSDFNLGYTEEPQNILRVRLDSRGRSNSTRVKAVAEVLVSRTLLKLDHKSYFSPDKVSPRRT